MRNISKFFVICLLAIGYLTQASPAKAFYLEVPQFFKDAMQTLNASPVMPKGQVKGEFEVAPLSPLMPVQQVSSMPLVGQNPAQPPAPTTCMVNGAEQAGSCQQLGAPQNYQPQPGQPNMAKPEGLQTGQNMGMGGPSPKDMQRGIRDIKNQLKQFELMVARLEKKGVAISADIKTKIAELKAEIDKFSSATPEDLANFDMGNLGQKMRDLEDERQNLQQMDNILREMNRIQSSIKAFEKQVQKLAKQKMAVPQEVTDNLAKVQVAIIEIKAGKMDNADDIFELVQNLDENRGEMEMLARWPQTVKEIDRQVKNLDSQLKRSKTIVDRLSKKGIDLSAVYAEFASAVAKMKETRDMAKAQISTNAADAFDLIQNDFFGQMDDVMQNQKIIAIMGNSAQFQSDFTRQTNQSNQKINSLKKQKLDTADLEAVLAQMKTNGAQIKEMFKAKPLDPDAIVDALNELQNLGQDFAQKVADLTGVDEQMPWDSGIQQFKPIEVSPALNNLIPRQPQGPQGDGGGQTCSINGIETPGKCQ